MPIIDTLTWKEFCTEALELLEISEQLHDNWSWEVKNDEVEGQSFLKYKDKLRDPLTQKLIQIEYHVLYSISYQVPILYFQAFNADGKQLSLDEIWNLFQRKQESKYSKEEMFSIITQMDHPIYFRPFMCFHPCHTAEILAARPKSCNRVLTFISVMGPFLYLNMDNAYGLKYPDKSTII